MPTQHLWQQTLTTLPSTFSTVMKVVGVKALGNIMASRKGMFGLVAIAISYIALFTTLPAGAPAELVAQSTNTFVWIVSGIAALYMGGTAVEDAAEKHAGMRILNQAAPADPNSAVVISGITKTDE